MKIRILKQKLRRLPKNFKITLLNNNAGYKSYNIETIVCAKEHKLCYLLTENGTSQNIKKPHY